MLFVLAISVAALSLTARIQSRFMRFLFAYVFIFLLFFAEIAQFVSFYFQGTGFNERFFFHFSVGNLEAAWKAFPWISFFSGALILFLLLSLGVCVRRRLFRRLPKYIPVLVLAITPFLQSPVWDLVNYYSSQIMLDYDRRNIISSRRLKTLGLHPDALTQNNLRALPGKNLVLIYLESLERIYTDNNIFPQLTPEINKMAGEGIEFTNMIQIPGTGWTMGGIVASMCGTPLLWDNNLVHGNDILASGFLSKAPCLGDILHKAGYYQEYLGGASTRFGGKGIFFKMHGYDEVNGREELAERLPDPQYQTGWGLYDDSLFDIAANEYERLAGMNRPFNLTILTLDTHHPEGNPSFPCKPYRLLERNSMLDAVHCTDQLLDKFLRRISQHPAFPDTVVVVKSDHLAMRNAAEKLYPEDYKRKLLFLILNTGRKGKIEVTSTPLDVAPTLLDALHVETNAVFLAGRDLLKNSIDKSVPDFGNPETSKAIKYINSHFFSASDFKLCEGEFIVKYSGGDVINIGDRPIPLYYKGEPVPASRFSKDMAILAVIGDGLSVIKASVMPYTLLCKNLYQNAGSFFLVVKPAEGDGGVEVLASRPGKDLVTLGRFESLKNLSLRVDSCMDICNDADKPAGKSIENISNLHSLKKLCVEFRMEPAFYNGDTGKLTIPKLLIEDAGILCKAVLLETRSGFFKLKDYSVIKSASSVQENKVIYPSFNGFTLKIPLLQSNHGPLNFVTMKLGSRAPVVLEVTGHHSNFFTRQQPGLSPPVSGFASGQGEIRGHP